MAYQMLTVDSVGSQRVVTDGQIGGRANLTVYVDALYGSDSTGLRGYKNLPFQTITAAVTAASNGDMIYVQPGTYNETDLIGAKTAINFYFELGAKVIYTGVSEDAIFDTSAGVDLKVSGNGYFDHQVGVNSRIVYNATGSSTIYFEAQTVYCDGEASIEISGPMQTTQFKINHIACNGGVCFLISASSGTIILDVSYANGATSVLTNQTSGSIVFLNAKYSTGGSILQILAGEAYINGGVHKFGTNDGITLQGGTLNINNARISSIITTGLAINFTATATLIISNTVLESGSSEAYCIGHDFGVTPRIVGDITSDKPSEAEILGVIIDNDTDATLCGSSASGGTLTLKSTHHATKGGVFVGPDDYLILPELASAPSAPPSGYVAFYAKSDTQLYRKDDNDVETVV